MSNGGVDTGGDGKSRSVHPGLRKDRRITVGQIEEQMEKREF